MTITYDRVNRHLGCLDEKDIGETKRSSLYKFEGCDSRPSGGVVQMVKYSGKAAELENYTVADPGFIRHF